MKTTFDLLRHGEVEGGRRYRGRTDDALTPTGWQQMHSTVADHQDWDIIISSPLIRCRQFAEQLSRQLNTPLIIEPDLTEIDFGDWEGMTAEDIRQLDPEALTAYYQDPTNNVPPNAENYPCFSARTRKALQKALNNHSGQHLLIITHAGVIRSLLAQILSIPFTQTFNILCEPACISRFQHFRFDNSEFFQLIFHHSEGV